MAITNELPGVEVAVTVNDSDLQEYHDDDVEEADRTITQYIEAQQDQLFEIRIMVPMNFTFQGDTLAFTTFIDGNWAVEALVGNELCDLCDSTERIKGMEDSSNMIRKFRFRALELDDNGSAPKKDSPAKSMGSIIVHVNHRSRGSALVDLVPAVLRDDERVTEKDLKGRNVSHSVSLAEAVPSTEYRPEYITTNRIRGLSEPSATFIFLYRSEDALKSMRLIEHTPTPEPEAFEDDGLGALTREELLEVLRSRPAGIKQEPDVRIKRERSPVQPRRCKKSRTSALAVQLELDDEGDYRDGSTPTLADDEQEVEVIDLSDDLSD